MKIQTEKRSVVSSDNGTVLWTVTTTSNELSGDVLVLVDSDVFGWHGNFGDNDTATRWIITQIGLLGAFVELPR